MKRWSIPIIVGLVLVFAAGFLGFRSSQPAEDSIASAPPTVPVERGDVQQTVTAPGQLVGTRQTTLSMDTSGRLTAINVRRGDIVQAGDILAQLDSAPLEENLAQARLRLSQAETENERSLREAELALQTVEAELMQARLRFPNLTSAEIRLRQAQEALASTQDELQKARNRPWEPARVIESYERAVESAQDALAITQAEHDSARGSQSASSLQLGTLEASIEKARINLERLQGGVNPFLVRDVHKAEAALEAATLVAPYDGVVLDVNAIEGDTVSSSLSIILLADPAAVEVRASVIEEDLPLVQIDQPVDLFFDAAPDAIVQGRVARIVPQRLSGDRPLYPVYITLDVLPTGVVSGMTVDASLVIDSRSNVLRLPRAIVRARSDGSARVKVWLGDHEEERILQIGLRGDLFVEIVSGLREGEQVVGQ